MPQLEIKCCEDCPYHKIHREEWMDDCYTIICEHEEQTNTEGFNHKIRYDKSIYFNCPLEKSQEEE